MNTQLILLFVVCSILFNPVLGVGRLFVDEITGYTNEDVTAEDVFTPLLIVDDFTVTNGVTAAGGSDSHFVDTPGTIELDAALLNFVAHNSIEITSLGESVAFSGNNVTFAADNNLTIDAVDASIVSGDILGTIGGTFSTYGTDANLETIFDMTFNAGEDFFLDSAERIQMTTNQFNIGAQDDITISSAESNIFIQSLLELTMTASDTVDIVAESGLEIGSAHGDTQITALNDIHVLGENFIYTTETNSFSISDSLNLETASIAGDIFMYTERAFIDIPDGDLTLDSTGVGAQTAFLTSGTIESTSGSFSVEADDILLVSVDATTFTTRTNFLIESSNNVEITASGGMEYEASGVLAESTASNINIDVFGKSYYSSTSADLLINAGDSFTFTTGSTSISSTNAMELNSDDFIVTSSDVVDFYSNRDILVNAPSFIVTANGAGFDSHEQSTFRSQDISFTSATSFTADSSGSIVFQNSNDITHTAEDDIIYTTTRESTFSSFEMTVDADDIDITSDDLIHISTGGALDFLSEDDTDIFSPHLALIANNDLDFVANEILIDSDGQMLIEAFSVNMDGLDIGFFYDGNSIFTTDNIVVAVTDLDVDGDNIIFSSTDSMNVIGTDTLEFDALSTFIFMPFDLTTVDLTITTQASSHFSSGFNHQNVLRLDVSGDIIDTHNAVDISGGFVDVNVANTVLGDAFPNSPNINFSVSGERDFVLDVAGDLTFDIDESAIITAANFKLHSGAFFRMEATEEILLSIDKTLSFLSNDDIDFTANAISVNADDITIFSDNTIIFADIDEATFNVEQVIDIISRDRIEFNSRDFTTVTRDTHITSSSWDMFADDIDFEAGDGIELFYKSISTSAGLTNFDNGLNFDSFSGTSTAFTANDINVDIDELNVIGGSVSFTSDIFSVTSLGDLVIGNTASTPANINLENLNLLFGSDFEVLATGGGSDPITFIATGVEYFEQRGMTMNSGDFVTSSFDLSVEAFQGAVVNTPTFTATATNSIDMTSMKSGIIGTARENDVSFISTVTDLNFISSAEMTIQAYDDISSTTGSSSLSAVDEINMHSTDNDLIFDASTLLSFTGNAWTLKAGFDEEISSDILFTVELDTVFDFGDDVRFQALGNEQPGQSNEQISFIGGDTLGLLSSQDQMSFYPSGEFSLDAELDSLFTATTGSLSFGSASNAHTIDTVSGQMFFTSGRDFSVNAGGIFGNIIGDVQNNMTLTVTEDIYGSANGTVALFSDSMNVFAGTELTFTALNDKSMIYSIGAAYNFETTGSFTTSNIDIIGKNSEIISLEDSLFFTSPVIDIGAGTPRISSNATDVTMTAIGDINISTPSDLLRYHSDATTTLLAEDGLMQSGGYLEFEALNLLELISNSIEMTAGNAINVDVGDGLISHDPVTLTSTGTGGMIMTSDTSFAATQFRSTNSFVEDITTSYKADTLSGVVTIVNAFTSNSESLSFDSDFDLTFEGFDTDFTTTGNSAKISVLTEGANGDIQIDATSYILNSAGATNIIATGSIVQTTTSTMSISATGLNSGKISLDASNNILLQTDTGDVIVDIVGDYDLEAIGEDSLLTLSANDMDFNGDGGSISYSTTGGEGGSIIFESENQDTTIQMDADTWTNDIDGDYNINTLGSFTFDATNGPFESAAFGYANIGALTSLAITSTIGDIDFTAEDGDISIIALDSIGVTSAATIVSNSDSIDFSVRGNDTAINGEAFLQFTATNDIQVVAEDGDMLISAYSNVDIDSTGFLQIEASALTGVGITVTTTYAGGDYETDAGDSAFIISEDMNLIADGTAPQSGYVKIIASRDLGADYDPVYWQGGQEPPSVVISSGFETTIRSLTGDIRTEYASQLHIGSGDVNVLAGTSFEVAVRGDGRTITGETFYGYVFSPSAISIHDVSGVQFITELGGDILIESGAAAVLVDTGIVTVRSDIDDMFIESSGSVSFIGQRNPFRQPSITGGLDISSTGDVVFTAFDSDIILFGNEFLFATPNINDSILFESEDNSPIEFINNSDIVFNNGGDVTLTTLNSGDIIFSADFANSQVRLNIDDMDITAGDDLYFSYASDLEIFSDTITFDTNRVSGFPVSETFADETAYVRLTGSGLVDDADANLIDIRPVVSFPENVRFVVPAQETNIIVSQGTWCETNRQIGFGESNQGGLVYDDDIFCVCIDHVWACIYDEPFSNYYYDRYNVIRPYP